MKRNERTPTAPSPTLLSFGELLKWFLHCTGLLTLIENAKTKEKIQNDLNASLDGLDMDAYEGILSIIPELLKKIVPDDGFVSIVMYSLQRFIFDIYADITMKYVCLNDREDSIKDIITNIIPMLVKSVHYSQFVYRKETKGGSRFCSALYDVVGSKKKVRDGDIPWFFPEIKGVQLVMPTQRILKDWMSTLSETSNNPGTATDLDDEIAARLGVSGKALRNWVDGKTTIRSTTLADIQENAESEEIKELVIALFISEFIGNIFRAMDESFGRKFTEEFLTVFKEIYIGFINDYNDFLCAEKAKCTAVPQEEWQTEIAPYIFNHVGDRFLQTVDKLGQQRHRFDNVTFAEMVTKQNCGHAAKAVLFTNHDFKMKHMVCNLIDFQQQIQKTMRGLNSASRDLDREYANLKADLKKLQSYKTKGEIVSNPNGERFHLNNNMKFFSYMEPYLKARLVMLKTQDLVEAQKLFMEAVRNAQFSVGTMFERILIDAKLATLYLMGYKGRGKDKVQLKKDNALLNQWCRITRKAEPFLAAGDEERFQEAWNSKYAMSLAFFSIALHESKGKFRGVRMFGADSEFMEFIKNGNVKRAEQELRKERVDINTVNSAGESALTLAIVGEYYDLAMKILKLKKTDKKTPKIDKKTLHSMTKVGSSTAMSQAIYHLQFPIVAQLVKIGYSLNEPCFSYHNQWQSPLHYCFDLLSEYLRLTSQNLFSGDQNSEEVAALIKIAKLLIHSGSELNKKGDSCFSPLNYATYLQSVDLVQYLLENGASPNESAHPTPPLALAIKLKNHDIARLFVKHGADIEKAIKVVNKMKVSRDDLPHIIELVDSLVSPQEPNRSLSSTNLQQGDVDYV